MAKAVPLPGADDDASELILEPAKVTALVTSYFRLPPIWIEDQKGERKRYWIRDLPPFDPAIYHNIVFSTKMACGIRVSAQRDGLFSFDFTEYDPATHAIVPEYLRPANQGYIPPPEVQKADARQHSIAAYRAVLLNAHQACLETAGSTHGSGSSIMGTAVSAHSTYHTLHLGEVPSYSTDLSQPVLVGRTFANGVNGFPAHTGPRRQFNVSSIVESFRLLDEVITQGPGCIAIIEAAYVSAIRSLERRNAECIVIGWSTIEQLLELIWKRTLHGVPPLVSGKRWEKLNGRDYTASVKTEIVELLGQLTPAVYADMEIVRVARNKWAHELKTPSDEAVRACISAVRALIMQVLGLKLHFQPFPGGGVTWPKSLLDDYQARQETTKNTRKITNSPS